MIPSSPSLAVTRILLELARSTVIPAQILVLSMSLRLPCVRITKKQNKKLLIFFISFIWYTLYNVPVSQNTAATVYTLGPTKMWLCFTYGVYSPVKLKKKHTHYTSNRKRIKSKLLLFKYYRNITHCEKKQLSEN